MGKRDKVVSRQSRDSNIPDKTFLKPFDVTKFGSADDPCFGLFYDLTADECNECGDIEICAIAFARNQHLKRAEIEATQKFKDLEEEELLFKTSIREYIKTLRSKGKGDTIITVLAAKKFEKPKSYIKPLL
jgi:hypothetical protein